MNCKDDVEEKFIRDWNEGKVKRVFDGKIMSEQIPEEAIYDPSWCIEYCKAYAEQLRDKTRANRAEHAAECIEYLLSLVDRKWVSLTAEEIAEISEFHFHGAFSGREIYEDIETRLKEKNL
jgi:hypothetical protein